MVPVKFKIILILQTNTTITQILQILHDGGRIDRFSTGNVFLTNIFGELLPFSAQSFHELTEENLIHAVHLHSPCGDCFKISPAGVTYIGLTKMEEKCPIPA